MRTRIIGNPLSPFARKVLAVLEHKQIQWEMDPLVPFYGDDRFTRLSPARRIPVLVDDLVTVPDSSVICQYLEERYPRPRLYPEDMALRARARWLEEYADTHVAHILIWKYWNERILKPFVWNKEPDKELLERLVRQDIPHLLEVLEEMVPEEEGFFCGPEPCIADLSIATQFRNALLAGYELDVVGFPRIGSLITRMLAYPCFANLRKWEEICMKTPVPKQREALQAAGAPLTADTYATDTPRTYEMAQTSAKRSS